ncbi:MAG: formylmethanofuran dehydrogenase subunit B [Planctomycetaceae bacterium]|nr:formylmethanofuran dehydrogenase subunit B [Planctomycetaceae bacterium]
MVNTDSLLSLRNVVCPGCGCVCDDVRLTFRAGVLEEFQPECQLGERWFSSHARAVATPFCIRGTPSSLVEVIEFSAKILSSADYPLIYGLSRSATPGQRAAVRLAELLGGAIDTTASLCHGPSIMAIQEVGEVTCSLGEIRNRADLVVFWGCDPGSSHPRHAERYSVFPDGKYLPNGRNSRTVVLIGSEENVKRSKLAPDGEPADLIISVPSGGDFEVLNQMRAVLAGADAEGVPHDILRLVRLMKSCRYGVVFFGLGLAGTKMWNFGRRSATGHISVAALLKLVAELNAFTRFTARRMRLQGDVSGADNVMLWQTGYPFGVDFSRGFPRYNPGEYTANELLERGDTDAVLLFGADTVSCFSQQALAHLSNIPVILLDYPGDETDPGFIPTVRITTAVYGIHAAGTLYRMDNVPLSLRRHLPSDLPTDENVLDQLRELCSGKHGNTLFGNRRNPPAL